jgi:hypothetical protein
VCRYFTASLTKISTQLQDTHEPISLQACNPTSPRSPSNWAARALNEHERLSLEKIKRASNALSGLLKSIGVSIYAASKQIGFYAKASSRKSNLLLQSAQFSTIGSSQISSYLITRGWGPLLILTGSQVTRFFWKESDSGRMSHNKPRMGARGAKKVKTGCQTCKYDSARTK